MMSTTQRLAQSQATAFKRSAFSITSQRTAFFMTPSRVQFHQLSAMRNLQMLGVQPQRGFFGGKPDPKDEVKKEPEAKEEKAADATKEE